MYIPLYLALKYLLYNKKNKNISLMIKVCFIGITIGTFSLMMTLMITNGFEKTIYKKIKGINSEITITHPYNKIDPNIKIMLEKEFKAQSSASSMKQVLISNDEQYSIILKGIEPDEAKVTNIEEKILAPKKPIAQLLNGNNIIIGEKLAKSLDLQIGDDIKILVPDEVTKNKLYFKTETVSISGIFNVGLDEYDTGFAFTSLDFFNKIFEQTGVDQISIKKNISIEKLKERLPEFSIHTWEELYPALISSLKLEKYVMFIIMALITLVASLNMISLLFIQVQQKQRDIAILKTMGMLDKSIKHIFLILGLSIAMISSTLGLTLAGITGYLLKKYPFIELPDVYYVTHLPVQMDIELFLLVFLCTLSLAFIAILIPAKSAGKLSVTEILRMSE